ncbi:MAG: PQQ-dependent dehydrogenase, methanol/ethanol family [Pseudomonadota bacterium]
MRLAGIQSVRARYHLTLAALLLAVAACGQDDTPTSATSAETEPAAQATGLAAIDGARIVAADSEPGSWLAHGRTYDEQRFSPLKQITADNVGDLGIAWYWDTGTSRGLEASPIVVDGRMYSTGTWSTVWAHDAKTGELLWEFDPEVPRAHGVYACCDVVNRGVAVWKGKVYVGTIDGRLMALNAADGTVVWSQQTTPRDRAYTITGAPRVLKDMVIIGNGGAEYGVRGYVTAYDTETGDEKWRFYTVPGNPADPYENDAMKAAATTWRGDEYWKVGGGGTVWDSMAFDPELDLLYIGVGNGSPWNRYIRSPGGGDNLYLSSIVALRPDTGEYVWHYQTTPGDNWDYTATQHMILADMEIKGEARKVLMQAPKNGFFYVIDRVTGEFISAEAYVPVEWATHIDPETGKPVESPDAQYANDLKTIQPGPLGGHNWHPMTYSPDTGLVYIPALGLEFNYAQDNAFKYDPKTWNLGIDFNTPPPATPDELIETLQKVRGHLAAWDPVKQTEVWRVQHPQSWNGGLVSTAGNLVFQGRADGQFAAYRATDGKLLKEIPVNIGIIAPPVTYEIDGEQYVTVVAGWGGAFGLTSGVPRHKSNAMKEGRILTFKLGGEVELPQPSIAWMDIPAPPEMDYTTAQVTHGQKLYAENCNVCHGPGVISSSSLPDLRYMTAATHASWDAIVRGGAYTGKGMVSFAHVLDEQGSRDVHAYVIESTKQTIALCQTEYRTNYPELLETACVRAVPTAEVQQEAAGTASE